MLGRQKKWLQYAPNKSTCSGEGGGGPGDGRRIHGSTIQGMDKSTFSNSMEKSTSFNTGLTNMLLWMQWISLEALLNAYLHFVFYMYIHVSC